MVEKMTAEQIIAELERQDMDVAEFAYGDCENPIENIGEWEEVKQRGGTDQGSEWYSIKYFKDHDLYIRTDGYYQSHNGTDFDEGFGHEVFPKQKTITVYENQK